MQLQGSLVVLCQWYFWNLVRSLFHKLPYPSRLRFTFYRVLLYRPLTVVQFQPPEVCSSDTGVLAVYSMELRGESGGLVFRVGGEYHESELMEETLTLASCSSYSLSVTVSLPSFPQLGSHTNTNTFNVSHGCPSTPTAATERGKY